MSKKVLNDNVMTGKIMRAAKSSTYGYLIILISFFKASITTSLNIGHPFFLQHCKIAHLHQAGHLGEPVTWAQCAFRQSYSSPLPLPTGGLLVSRAILTSVNVPEPHLPLPNRRTALALPSSSYRLPNLILFCHGKLNQSLILVPLRAGGRRWPPIC